MPVEEVQKTLRGITCHRPAGFGPERVLSCGDGIAQAMAKQIDVENGDFVPMVDLQGEGTYTSDPAEQPATTVATAPPQSAPTFGSGSAPAAETYVEGRRTRPGLRGRLPILRRQPAPLRRGLHEVRVLRLQRLRVAAS